MRSRELPHMLMYVRPFGLAPATEYDEERFAELKQGTIVSVMIPPTPPNERMRRKFHAAIGKLAEGVGVERVKLRRDLKIATKQFVGFVADRKHDELRVIPVSESGMDDVEFKAYSETIAAYVSEHYGLDLWSLGEHAEPREEINNDAKRNPNVRAKN